MKLYATVTSERVGRDARKGADEFLEIELSAFGRKIGTIVLHTATDATGKVEQYLLKHKPARRDGDWFIIEEAHRTEGTLQRYEGFC